MNRDPFGLGFLLYGFAPARVSPYGPGTLLAAGVTSLTLIPDGHEGCSISTFCRNPLHPGPCAGWKKKLGIEAPGALHALEKAHKEKVAANRIKRAEAKSAAAKTLTSRHHASPLHAKKALTKRANMLLGNDEAKASGKADKVILNKAEIKKYSKIKAAQMNALRTKHGLQEDPGLEDRLAEALAKDNANGKDDNYRAAIAGSSDSLGAQLAQKHCKKGDGDCDGIPYENLRNELAADAHVALLTGDDSGLDKTLADYSAGKLDVSPTPNQLAKTKIHDAETAQQVLDAAGEALSKHGGKSGLHPDEAQVMQEKLHGVADGSFGAPSEGQKQAAADNLGALFGVDHPGSAKNKAKADAKAKAAAMMDEAKAKADKMAENKAKAAQLADAKAKAGDLMDAAKAKTDKLAEDKAKAKKTPAQLVESMFGPDSTAAPSTPQALDALHKLSDADVAALDPETKKKINGWLTAVGKLFHGDTALEVKELQDKLGDKPKAPAAPAAAVPTPDDLTASQAALFDDVASGKTKLIKQADGSWWKSENGGPIKTAPKATVDAIVKKGHLEKKSEGGGGTEVWGVTTPSENAQLADKGMKFGLGLQAFIKGNKSLGTKAAQKAFADKIQKELDGEGNPGVIRHGAEVIAGGMVGKATKASMAKPFMSLGHGKVKDVVTMHVADEIEKGLKGEDGDTPWINAFKEGLTAQDNYDFAGVKAAEKKVTDLLAQEGAKKAGIDPSLGLSSAGVAATIVFKPGIDYNDGKTGQRVGVLNAMDPEEFGKLEPATRKEIANWLENRADALDTSATDPDFASVNAYAKMVELQQKFGLAEHKPHKDWSAEPPAQVKTLKDAIAADAPAWQIKQEADKLTADELAKHLTADELAKAKAAQAKPATTWDPNADAPTMLDSSSLAKVVADDSNASHAEVVSAVNDMTKADWDGLQPHEKSNLITAVADAKAAHSPGAWIIAQQVKAWHDNDAAKADEHGVVTLPDGATVDLHKMFADDGDPNHEQVVEAVTAMTQEDYDALAPWEKGNLWAHVKDADSAGEPGASMNLVKIKSFAGPDGDPNNPKPKPKSIVSTSPDAKKASDYATGVLSGTAKQKLAAYEKVSGDEFQALTPAEQKLILADLKAIEAKFLDPKKKQQAKDHHDYLAGYGGGAPAAPAAATTGAPLSDEEKLSQAEAALFEMIQVVGDAPDPAKAAAAGKGILAKAQANGSFEQLAKQVAEFQGQINMVKLASMHKVDPAAAKQVEGALQADIEKKLIGSSEPTPVYDAWLKVMQGGTAADLQKLGEAAGSGPLAAKPAPASNTDINMVKGSTSMAIFDAWFGKPAPGANDAATIDAQVKEALSEGVGSPKHQKWAAETAHDAAGITLDSTFEGLDWGGDDEAKIPADVKDAALAVLAHDYEKSLLSTSAYDGGKPADYLKGAVQEINKASADLAVAQGWPLDSPQIKEYEHAILQAKLENLPKLWPVPAKSTTSVTAPATSGGPVTLGHGATTSFTDEQQQILTGTIKAQIVNLSSNSQHDWDSLVAAAAAHAGKDGLPETLSVMDVLNAVDAGHAKNLGVPNTGKLREKVLNWLKTPAGKKYAEDNAAPKAKLVGQMTGDLSIKLPPGVKVQPTGGPGGYDPDYKPTNPGGYPDNGGWAMQTWQQAIADREAYWAANPGTKWTEEAKNGLISYTMGSATINDWLRGETSNGTKVHTASHATKQMCLDIQSAMIPTTRDLFLRRGSGWEMFPPGLRSTEALKGAIGTNITDKAFLSTSVTGGGSHGFGSKPVGLEIEAPKGTHGIMVEDISAFKGGTEQEMLLAAGTTLRILGVKEVNGRTIVRMRVVTPK